MNQTGGDCWSLKTDGNSTTSRPLLPWWLSCSRGTCVNRMSMNEPMMIEVWSATPRRQSFKCVKPKKIKKPECLADRIQICVAVQWQAILKIQQSFVWIGAFSLVLCIQMLSVVVKGNLTQAPVESVLLSRLTRGCTAGLPVLYCLQMACYEIRRDSGHKSVWPPKPSISCPLDLQLWSGSLIYLFFLKVKYHSDGRSDESPDNRTE